MGAIIKFSCPKCKYSYEHHSGVGMLLFSMQCNSRKLMRDGEWGEKWKKLIEENPEGTATINTSLCLCKKCRKYYDEPRIIFWIPKEGYHYEYSEKHKDMVIPYFIKDNYQILDKEEMLCHGCGEEAIVIENMDNVICVKCGEVMNAEEKGHFD